ncbi:unnamed protein product [Somion occarium]|uniref:Protein kinase domain-containing protein n=1 Tax=Somion occarium TaxID=3059160 RepID=A0ABP1CRU0_9APHY
MGSEKGPVSLSTILPINLSTLCKLAETNDMVSLWDSLEPWFRSKGYILYPRSSSGNVIYPSNEPVYTLNESPAKFPFAHSESRNPEDRSFFALFGLFAAVNVQRRDIVIKLLPHDYPELAIFKRLVSEPQCSDPLNLTIPVLDILTYSDEISFVIMPRWGDTPSVLFDGFDCLETAFEFALCMLKNLIVHRDIKLNNILINSYGGRRYNSHYHSFFASKKARFVLCDFSISMMFSSDTLPAERVCPASASEDGYFDFHPPDAANGETIYDPFAYDVACLGGLLCESIGYMTPLAPPLAPFLDGMITPDISTRYTAAEALEAFIQLKDSFDPTYLSNTRAPAPPTLGTYIWQSYDRWAGLPEEFVREHTAKRAPVRPRRKLQFLDDTSIFVEWNAPPVV